MNTITNCPKCGINVTVPELNRSHVYLYHDGKCDWEQCLVCDTIFSMSTGALYVKPQMFNISTRK